MAVVVDDQLLLEVLAGVASPALRDLLDDTDVFTTGCWYTGWRARCGQDRGQGRCRVSWPSWNPRRRNVPSRDCRNFRRRSVW